MSYRNTTYIQRQTVTKPTGTGGLGPLLATAGADQKKIFSDAAVRLVIAVLIWVLQHRNGSSMAAGMDLALLVIYAGFTLWPLLHLRDRLEFHANGLRFKGEEYAFNGPVQVTWRSWKVFFTDNIRLQVHNETLAVTYVEDVQGVFTRCYTDVV